MLSSLTKLCIFHGSYELSHQIYLYLDRLTCLVNLSLVYFRRSAPFNDFFLDKLVNLEYLCIGNCLLLNDKSIQRISNLHKLRYLSLFSGSITDQGADSLTKLSNLITLDISCNHKITSIQIGNSYTYPQIEESITTPSSRHFRSWIWEELK